MLINSDTEQVVSQEGTQLLESTDNGSQTFNEGHLNVVVEEAA